jgi:hypothetical protein
MQSEIRTKLDDWRAALRITDDCPYVGPRPQTSERDGPGLLIGRSDDLERISRAVLSRPLVIVDGGSGVGKSSLLQNGLMDRLEHAGFTVFVVRKWDKMSSDDRSEAAIEEYLAEGIERSDGDSRAPDTWTNGLEKVGAIQARGLSEVLFALDQESGVVLILDQFEELLRHHLDIAEGVMKWVKLLAFRQSTRVLISLRTDSYYQLEPLLRGVRPFSTDRVTIEEISDPASIRSVISTARQRPAVGGDSPSAVTSGNGAPALISGDAAEQLVNIWLDQLPRTKLLDLQATLYALYFRAEARFSSSGDAAPVKQPVLIEAEDVDALLKDARRLPGNVSPLSFGLREAIRLKILHAERAASRASLDEYLISGTREVVRRAAPLLSSGGFKVSVHQSELALRVLSREMRVLEHELIPKAPDHKRATSAELSDTVRAIFRDLGRLTDALAERPLVSGETKGSLSRQVSMTAGPMMAASARDTLFEEVRRVAFAIEWLEATEIIRRDPAGTLTLIHDGAGDAIRDWAEQQGESPDSALRQLTAARGEHYIWTEVIGGERFPVVVNLNWRECRISARFERVVFVNCDFTGSRFDGCEFRGVAFVNCLLDDANFEHCVFRGKMDLPRIVRRSSEAEGERGKIRMAPSFIVESPAREVDAFAAYLGHEVGNRTQFFSDTSGAPAIPGSPPAHHQGEVVARFIAGDQDTIGLPERVDYLSLPTGGAAMIGGRVCFLTLYSCRSEDDGSFGFHHVSGDGLFVVEQDGRIDIFDGAIRGISVTRDGENLLSAGETRKQGPARVELGVSDSIVANLYFSGELVGAATIQKSWILMLMNASDNSANGFEVNVQDCRYQFLVNTCDPIDSQEDSMLSDGEKCFELARGRVHSRFDLRNREVLVEALGAMDYRYRPERFEAVQRRRRGREK